MIRISVSFLVSSATLREIPPPSSPRGGAVSQSAKEPDVMLSTAKHLAFPTRYEVQILRPCAHQDDIRTQSRTWGRKEVGRTETADEKNRRYGRQR